MRLQLDTSSRGFPASGSILAPWSGVETVSKSEKRALKSILRVVGCTKVWAKTKSRNASALVPRFLKLVLVVSSSLCWVTFASAREEPTFQKENIFPLQDKHVHSSSIVECSNGDLLTCWFHGSGERTADDVLVQGARLIAGEKAWSAPFLMADTPGFPDCNPVLMIDLKGRVWQFWITVLANRWECSQLKYRRADALTREGPPDWTWQGIVQLKPGEKFARVMNARFKELQIQEGMWAEYAKPYTQLLLEAAKDPYRRQTGWMTRTHPVILPSGRIVLPLYSDGFNACLMGLSDDGGQTWRASSPIIGLGPIQPSVVRKRDGTLVAFCRDSGDAPNRVMVSRSEDQGETWTPALDCGVPNPGSSLEVIALTDGTWLMVCNYAEQGRHSLSALVSQDEGDTWKVQRQIEPSQPDTAENLGTTFGYPSLIQGQDEKIHLTYTYDEGEVKTIRHCVFNTEWLHAL